MNITGSKGGTAMYKEILKNECGDMSFFTIFVILAINMLMAFVLLFASVKIN